MRRPNRPTFAPDRKQTLAAIRDLLYEYKNLMVAAHFDLQGMPPWRTNCDDAFLLGCRKFHDFLMNDARQDDDVLAIDYLPPGARRTWDLPIWRKWWQKDINKYLTHITYRRTENRDAKGLPHWVHTKRVPQLRDEFNKAWWDFRDAVTDSEFCAEFDKQLRDHEDQVAVNTVSLRRL
jgi:hypothetical protein